MILKEKNRWHLSEEKKEEVRKLILETIDKIAAFEITDDSADTRWEVGTDFSDIGTGPYHIKEILEELGYNEDSFSDNGWEMDYWFHFQHPESNKYPPLCLSGTAIIHEVYLHGEEEDYVTYEEREEKLRNDPEFQKMIQDGMSLIAEAEALLKDE